MTEIRTDKLIIVIDDGSPEERLCWIRRALLAAMRHYAMNPAKRENDHDLAVELTHLLEEFEN